MPGIKVEAYNIVEATCSNFGERCIHARPDGCDTKSPEEVINDFDSGGCNEVKIPVSNGRGVVYRNGTMIKEKGFMPKKYSRNEE